jgi:hypothetical protein
MRNYADLDAPAEGSFIPQYGLLLTPPAFPQQTTTFSNSRGGAARSRSRSSSRERRHAKEDRDHASTESHAAESIDRGDE